MNKWWNFWIKDRELNFSDEELEGQEIQPVIGEQKKAITIHENLIGNFFYHIAVNDTPLCGRASTMRRDLRLESWGIRSDHIGERYCQECEKLAKEKGIL